MGVKVVGGMAELGPRLAALPLTTQPIGMDFPREFGTHGFGATGYVVRPPMLCRDFSTSGGGQAGVAGGVVKRVTNCPRGS